MPSIRPLIDLARSSRRLAQIGRSGEGFHIPRRAIAGADPGDFPGPLPMPGGPPAFPPEFNPGIGRTVEADEFFRRSVGPIGVGEGRDLGSGFNMTRLAPIPAPRDFPVGESFRFQIKGPNKYLVNVDVRQGIDKPETASVTITRASGGTGLFTPRPTDDVPIEIVRSVIEEISQVLPAEVRTLSGTRTGGAHHRAASRFDAEPEQSIRLPRRR